MINWHQAKHFLLHAVSAKWNGHGVHSPFAYRLCEEVFYNTNSFYDFEELQQVREALLKDSTKVETGSFGAGSRTFAGSQRRVNSIAARGISQSRQSELFYKLINYLKYSRCLELGTSLGMNALYLARANRAGTVLSIEGSQALHQLAQGLAKKTGTANLQLLNSDFDSALPAALQQLKPADLVYIDGNHTREATLRYFEQALPYIHQDSVIIFDDIYWSKGMTQAWKQIIQHNAVTLSIDAFYFGLVFFKPEIKEKTQLKFFL